MKWQPIETAPKDGQVILLYRAGNGIKSVIPARWAYILDPDYPWQALYEECGDNFYCDDDYMKAWMPLPEPPQEG